MLIADFLLVIITIVWLIAASVQDIRKREVANWLCFSLLSIALAVRAIAAIIFSSPFYFLYGLAGFAAFFCLANLLYYGRLFAGGDAKLFMALGAALATYPVFAKTGGIIITPFLLIFLVNSLFIGSVYGIFFSIFLATKNRKKFAKEIKGKWKIGYSWFFVLFVLLVFFAFTSKIFFLNFLAFLFLVPYLFLFVKAVENSCMVRMLRPEQITEGDWLVNTLRIRTKKKIITIKPTWEGLSKKEIALIKKVKIKKIKIKYGVPFVPVFLLALIASLFGNMLFWLVSLIA